MMESIKNRNYLFDLMRCLSVLWIVGVWHLSNYAKSLSVITDKAFALHFTHGVLSCFTLLSGLLASTQIFKDRHDFFNYYLKKLMKLYPLYAIASVFFVIFHMMSVQQFLCSLSFISLLTNCAPITLWYAEMIFIFYLLTPFVLKIDKPIIRFVVTIIIWGGGITYCKNSVLTIDCFSIGLFMLLP